MRTAVTVIIIFRIIGVFVEGRIQIVVIAVIVQIAVLIVIILPVIAVIKAVVISGFHVDLPLDGILIEAALAELIELFRHRIAEAVHAVDQHIPEINDFVLEAARCILVVIRVEVILIARLVIEFVRVILSIVRTVLCVILKVLVKINAVVVDLNLELFFFLRGGCRFRLCGCFRLRIIRSILCRCGLLRRFRFLRFCVQRPSRLRRPERSRLISDLCELLISDASRSLICASQSSFVRMSSTGASTPSSGVP